MRKIQIAVVVAVAMFALSLSATTLQTSSFAYYADGTAFGACSGLGCPSGSSVGDITTAQEFGLFVDVEYNGTDTVYNYTLVNTPGFTDAAGVIQSLNQMALTTPGITGTATSPSLWTGSSSPSFWDWLCTDPAQCSPANPPSNGNSANAIQLTMTLNGLVFPELQLLAVGYPDGNGGSTMVMAPTSSDWQATGAGLQFTPTPEPASMILLASGLLGGAVYKRRRK